MIPPPIFPFFPKPIKPVDEPLEKPHAQPAQAQTQAPLEPIHGDDYFDLLPDPIVSVILNKLLDAQSLCRCLLVSKRFASLVPQVDSVSVVAKPRLVSTLSPALPKKSFSRSFLKSIFAKLLQPVKSAKKAVSAPNFIGPGDLSQWICDSVKNFSEMRHLRVELPDNGGIAGFPETAGGLLKWSADFGKELQRCAIIGATSFEKPSSAGGETAGTDSKPDPNLNQEQSQNLLTDEELRSRVVWILSCLIAACARHGVAKQTLMDNADLRSAVIVDACKQGRLSMDEDQIKELRQSTDSSVETADPIWKRTTVPNVIVKLWYAPELVLPISGYVMKGATVVAIRPDTGKPEDSGAVEREYELLRGGFSGDEAGDEVIGEAVREIVKSKWRLMYKLQMNSF